MAEFVNERKTSGVPSFYGAKNTEMDTDCSKQLILKHKT